MQKAQVIRKTIADNVSTKVLFFSLTALLLLVFVSYAYFLNKTIMNVVSREKTEHQIATLSTNIGELEFKHIELKNSITLELAYQKGFLDAVPSQFIARAGTTKLTFNSQ